MVLVYHIILYTILIYLGIKMDTIYHHRLQTKRLELREAAEKRSFFSGPATTALTPLPPSSLVATKKFRAPKNSPFSQWPSLPPLSGRAIKKRPLFFCGFPNAPTFLVLIAHVKSILYAVLHINIWRWSWHISKLIHILYVQEVVTHFMQ